MCDQNKELEIYKQRCESFRSLQKILWGVPVMVMTVTGGLWFAIAKYEMTSYSRVVLLLFAIVFNVVFIAVLIRLRMIMDKLLELTNKYEGIEHKKGFVVVYCFSLGMLVMIAAFIMALFFLDKIFQRPEQDIPREVVIYNNYYWCGKSEYPFCKK